MRWCDDDKSGGGGGGCSSVDFIGSGSSGDDDGDSNESPTYNNKTDIESQPTKWYAELERPSQRISKRDHLFRVFRSECRVVRFWFSSV